MRRTRKAINLSLRKNILIRKAPIESGIKRVCTSRVQNDALEATLSLDAQAHSLCASCTQIDALEATLSHSAQALRAGTALRSPHREVQSTKERDLMHSVLNLCHSLLSLFF